MSRVYNFSAGPSMLPEEVLKKAQTEMLEYGTSGMSVMETVSYTHLSSGILAGYNMAAMLNGKDMFEPDSKTCIGALPLYISNSANTKFQPMNANFGIIDGLNERIRNKAERYNKIANRALDIMKDKLKGENDDE